ncbi:CLUMA_CG013334, isoform A [Clunio marinus]|uniref:CLUMA_CG013334, isoform A n=1 Tax=Clunio marinus TaxID=568069 RepID=A0A1J1ILV1_9DIPT|nr:CLUMA_CG013334, isoform A [Clunio marinus]
MDDHKVSRDNKVSRDAAKKTQLYKHWVRPRFLQYNYMYDYRLNYYDDVIDYLNKKDRGVKIEPPKPQTWAERVLRTVKDKPHSSCYEAYEAEHCSKRSNKLKITITNQINSYNYHSKGYTNRKYASIL